MGRPKGSKNKPKDKPVVSSPSLDNDVVFDEVKCSHLTARSVNVVNEEGNVACHIGALENIIGIWLTNHHVENGPTVAIYNDKYQGAVVGIYNSDHEAALNACIYSANMDGKRQAAIQVCQKTGKVDENGNEESRTLQLSAEDIFGMYDYLKELENRVSSLEVRLSGQALVD